METFNKKAVRQAVRAKIREMSEEQKSAISEQLCARIAQMEVVATSKVVALFISLADEPQTSTLLEALSSKRIVAPRIEGEEMEFYDLAEGLHEGAFGIMEPVGETPVEPSEIDAMIVPGVVFTREGARCGRGKGFYDKYLSRKGFRAHTIGICYPCQVVEMLPTEPHDRPLDEVVTL